MCTHICTHVFTCVGVPWWLSGKESACNAGDLDSIPGLGRSGGGNGNPLQYSHLENPMDRGAWQAIVHGVVKSWTQVSDNNNAHLYIHLYTYASTRVHIHTHFKPGTEKGIQPPLAQLSDHGKHIQNLWSLRPLRPGPAKGCLWSFAGSCFLLPTSWSPTYIPACIHRFILDSASSHCQSGGRPSKFPCQWRSTALNPGSPEAFQGQPDLDFKQQRSPPWARAGEARKPSSGRGWCDNSLWGLRGTLPRSVSSSRRLRKEKHSNNIFRA